MRKVYKNKVYDTSTSEFICHTPQGALYRKSSTLKFYLVSRNEQNVTPISWKEAESLIWEYGTRMQYDKLFRPESYTDKLRAQERITVPMTRNDYSMLRILAGNCDQNIREYLHEIIRDRYKAFDFKRNHRKR